MDVAALNVRINILSNVILKDAIGNHKNEWQPYYECYATVSGFNGSEKEEAGHMKVTEKMDFTVRFCKKMSLVVPDGFRVSFRNQLYNIVAVDPMNFKNKCIKLKCERVDR